MSLDAAFNPQLHLPSICNCCCRLHTGDRPPAGGRGTVRQRVGSALRQRLATARRRLLFLLLLVTVGAALWGAGRRSALQQQGPPAAAAIAMAADASGGATADAAMHGHDGKRILISYSYLEKDKIQQDSLDFFLRVGLGVKGGPAPAATDAVIVIGGDTCTPCQMVLPSMAAAPEAGLPHVVKAAWSHVVRVPGCKA